MTHHDVYTPLDALERDILASLDGAYDAETVCLGAGPLKFLSPRSVENESKAGRLRAVKCGKRVVFLGIDIARFLAALRRASDGAVKATVVVVPDAAVAAVPDDIKPGDQTNRECREAAA